LSLSHTFKKQREGERKKKRDLFLKRQLGETQKPLSERPERESADGEMGLEWRGLDLNSGWHMGWDRGCGAVLV
jgi:hypothetical protein